MGLKSRKEGGTRERKIGNHLREEELCHFESQEGKGGAAFLLGIAAISIDSGNGGQFQRRSMLRIAGTHT